ncbi:hypothetical protein GUITHDRAFT_145343 [Guillardia theta CCMP2712]|uniref:Uncharacterized protein n=1 Tax=Guillardia theta (strain CCMP2712) TaxID=905079 RepID=L1ILI8_GUITC|nr:hypothetical protein GUITHDRAFT_145343 [Guillardia theta CCMP2712]EKX36987.1 hypothetical protein GUITHDRAFT_145343 [Guillardia theta CCMP2712]|eukprot:XP_005823967.1 hypothetical protein GUITHDRAFT_145343 [Guillardia theta CCMP2712]
MFRRKILAGARAFAPSHNLSHQQHQGTLPIQHSTGSPNRDNILGRHLKYDRLKEAIRNFNHTQRSKGDEDHDGIPCVSVRPHPLPETISVKDIPDRILPKYSLTN